MTNKHLPVRSISKTVWEAIDRATYDELDRECAAGHFDLARLMREGGL